MGAVTGYGEIRLLRGILETDDAHGLYKRYGFCLEEGKYMSKKIG